MKNKLIKFLSFGLLLTPFEVFAGMGPTKRFWDCNSFPEGIEKKFCNIQNVANVLIPVIILFSLIYFILGSYELISNQENEEKKERSKKRMVWGAVGIFVMIVIDFLVNDLTTTF